MQCYFYLSLFFWQLVGILKIYCLHIALIFIFYRFYISCDILMLTLFWVFSRTIKDLSYYINPWNNALHYYLIFHIYGSDWWHFPLKYIYILSSIRVGQNKTKIFRGNYVNVISFTLSYKHISMFVLFCFEIYLT